MSWPKFSCTPSPPPHQEKSCFYKNKPSNTLCFSKSQITSFAYLIRASHDTSHLSALKDRWDWAMSTKWVSNWLTWSCAETMNNTVMAQAVPPPVLGPTNTSVKGLEQRSQLISFVVVLAGFWFHHWKGRCLTDASIEKVTTSVEILLFPQVITAISRKMSFWASQCGHVKATTYRRSYHTQTGMCSTLVTHTYTHTSSYAMSLYIWLG